MLPPDSTATGRRTAGSSPPRNSQAAHRGQHLLVRHGHDAGHVLAHEGEGQLPDLLHPQRVGHRALHR
ncbi:MAG TPA: hypothetical protein VH089_21310, partial [Streptosporangiaceae bacterium]|nr:hypothetical protein [Streptosporangiaceae bacterium]